VEDGQGRCVNQILLVLLSHLLHCRTLILLVACGDTLVCSWFQSLEHRLTQTVGFRDTICLLCVSLPFAPNSPSYGVLLEIQTAMERRIVDKELLLYASVGRLGCAFVGNALHYFKSSVEFPLNLRIKKHYSIHIFENMARLDVPTFDDPLVQTRLNTATASAPSTRSLAWDTISVIIALLTATVRLTSQLSVLIKVVGGQRDGVVFVVLHFGQELLRNNFKTGFDLFYTKGLYNCPMPSSTY
jgi:hypothetical protein